MLHALALRATVVRYHAGEYSSTYSTTTLTTDSLRVGGGCRASCAGWLLAVEKAQGAGGERWRGRLSTSGRSTSGKAQAPGGAGRLVRRLQVKSPACGCGYEKHYA